jgi:hypothetical protein
MNDDDGSSFAKPVAPGSPDVYLIGQALGFEFFFKPCRHFTAAGGMTGRSGA